MLKTLDMKRIKLELESFKRSIPKPATDLPKRLVRIGEYDGFRPGEKGIPAYHARRWSNIIAYGKLHDKSESAVLMTISQARYDNPHESAIFKDDSLYRWHYFNELSSDDIEILAELRADTLDWMQQELGEKLP